LIRGITLEAGGESQIGICYECNTKNCDSSKKQVYHCELCNKWFCELHLKPKFPYFVDWETIFDVQGNPKIKALFYSEYGREDGHADFVYLRKTIEKLNLEKRLHDKLIKQAIDRMAEANKTRNAIAWDRFEDAMANGKTITYKNIFGHEFTVPKEVYKNKQYRAKLNRANSSSEVQSIAGDYYRYHSQGDSNQATEETEINLDDVRAAATKTYFNKFKHEFDIPAGIYSIDKYYNKLNNAQTLEEVGEIIKEYRRDLMKAEKKHW